MMPLEKLAMVDQLTAAGFDQNQAETLVRVIADAPVGATNASIDLTLKQELWPIKTDLAVLKWMLDTLISSMKT